MRGEVLTMAGIRGMMTTCQAFTLLKNPTAYYGPHFMDRGTKDRELK